MAASARLLFVGLALVLGACSSKPTYEKAELRPIQTTLGVKQAWRAELGKARSALFQPAVVGAAVFSAGDGRVYRLNLENGTRVWQAEIGKTLSAGVGADSQIVVVATNKGEVIALDSSTGKEKWRAQASSEVVQSPVVGYGLVVVRSQDNRIHAFEAQSGKRRWAYQRQTPSLILRVASGLLLTETAVYAGMPGGRLIALTLNNGSPRWEVAVAFPKGATELERVADVVGMPMLQGRAVCAVTYQGRLACFDMATGQQDWGRDFSSNNGLSVDARFVFAADDRSILHAFSRNGGASVWRNDKLVYRDLTAPLSVGRAVVVGDSEGFVHWLSREDGAFMARSRADDAPIVVAPVATELGVLIQSQDGRLVAYIFE
ncbi:outer membrane protein assembly factor BamB [Parvibium lacunae]|uniref:Outer membrane protein assembly factor BamB n=1 Tax=Parvibium lacunae TaxID=1888893 RepID=A0A368L8M3_9BURK|nr:outer membrane protein assembly factor BamB [Parvibium lacunae]